VKSYPRNPVRALEARCALPDETKWHLRIAKAGLIPTVGTHIHHTPITLNSPTLMSSGNAANGHKSITKQINAAYFNLEPGEEMADEKDTNK